MKHTNKPLNKERLLLLQTINEVTNKPMAALSFVWMVIIVLELTRGISPGVERVGYVIWALFVIDFFIELAIAPSVKKYLRDNWLNALSLLLPAFRIIRVFQGLRLLRAARSLRSLNLFKIISSLNRGIDTVRRFSRNYGLRYVLVISGLILLAGATGILFFENSRALADKGLAGHGIDTYPDAIWWTAMLMTTIGSAYWPQTIEGRILTFVLALYSIAIFGYVTATLAKLLIEKNLRPNE